MRGIVARSSDRSAGRRPLRRVTLGLLLVVPAALGSLSDPRPALPAPTAALHGTLEEKVALARAGDGPVAAAWRRHAVERQRQRASARFAHDYALNPGLADRIHRIALEERIQPEVAFGLVKTESSFRRTAVSPVGAVGLTQVLPSTARWLLPGTRRSDLFHADTNLRIGFRYLRYLIDYYEGDVPLALTAYNRGPGTVDRLLQRGAQPWNGYARKVLRAGG